MAQAVGDAVAHDEPLFEVSTDKVDSEVPSPAAGLSDRDPRAGRRDGRRRYHARVSSTMTAPAARCSRRCAATPPAPGRCCSCAPRSAGRTGGRRYACATRCRPRSCSAAAAPAASAAAAATAAAAPPAAAAPAAAPQSGAAEASRTGAGDRVLSPVVRQLVDDNGLDPAEITGTGWAAGSPAETCSTVIDTGRRWRTRPRPRRRQRRHAARTCRSAAAPRRLSPPAGRQAARESPAPATTAGTGARDEIVPFTNIRRLTAEHMVRSKATSAHTLVVIEADYEQHRTGPEGARSAVPRRGGHQLTYLPFMARAVGRDAARVAASERLGR